VAVVLNSNYDWRGSSGIATREKALAVERLENGLHLEGGTGYEVDKLRGAEDGKQYTRERTRGHQGRAPA
jgi:hypothetical protein